MIIDLYSILIKILYTLGAGIIFMQLLGGNTLVSLLFYLTFIVVFLLWVIFEIKNLDKNGLFGLLVIILAVIAVLFNAMVQNADLSFEYFKKLMMFATTIMLFRVSSKLTIKKSDISYIQKLISAIAIAFIVVFFVDPIEIYRFREYITPYLTFKFTNPNLASMFLMCFLVFEFLTLLQSDTWFKKAFHIVLFGFLLFFVIKTQARNSIIAVTIFFILYFIIALVKNVNFKINKTVSAIVVIFPILFVLIYIQIINSDFLSNVFSFLEANNKDLDSRIIVWQGALTNISESPLFGAYYQASGGTGNFQAHNTHLDILVSYGAPVFVTVCIFLIQLVNNRDIVYTNKDSLAYMLGFISTIFLGLGEAALFSGGLGIYMWSALFLLMRNSTMESCE